MIAKKTILDTFAGTYTYSLQQMLYALGSALISALPEICEARLALPNKHHFIVDLEPFGLENDREVYYADDRPYGLIEGTRASRRRAGRGPRLDLIKAAVRPSPIKARGRRILTARPAPIPPDAGARAWSAIIPALQPAALTSQENQGQLTPSGIAHDRESFYYREDFSLA